MVSCCRVFEKMVVSRKQKVELTKREKEYMQYATRAEVPDSPDSRLAGTGTRASTARSLDRCRFHLLHPPATDL